MADEQQQDRGLTLRAQAMALLQQAAAEDGLQPFAVNHRHEYGTSTYLLWAKACPNEEEAAAVLDAEFEPEKGEYIDIEQNISLEEICGTAAAARVNASAPPVEGGHSKSITAVISAHATSDHGDGPIYAAFPVTAAFLEQLEKLAKVCKDHGLSETRVSGYPDWGPGKIDVELRLQCGEIVVLPNGSFWFTDHPKHADYDIESDSLDISSLREAFEAAADGAVEYLADDDEIREMYEEALAELEESATAPAAQG